MTVIRLLCCVTACALILGCPDKKPDVEKQEEDRTLLKLKEAQEKGDVGRGPPAQEDPNQKLADLATGGKADEGGPRPLPAKNDPVKLGTVSLQLESVATASTMSNGKISLSTDQQFLVVKLSATNQSEREQPLDFSTSVIQSKGQELPLARDAQRVGGTRELQQTFGAATGMQKAEVVLVFEVPAGTIGSGMTLRLKSPDLDPVILPLE